MNKLLKHAAWALPTIVCMAILISVTIAAGCPMWFSGMLFGLGLAYGFALVSLEKWANFLEIEAIYKRASGGGK